MATKIIRGLGRFMDEHGYATVAAMRGIASRQAAKDYSTQFARARTHVEIDQEACANPTCTICIQMCFYEALSQADGHVKVHPDNCIGCELCYDVCPFQAMSMHDTTLSRFDQGYFQIPEAVYETNKFMTQRNNPDAIGKSYIKKTA